MSERKYSIVVTAYEKNFPFDRISVMNDGKIIAEFDHTRTTNYSFNFHAFGGPKASPEQEVQMNEYRERIATMPYETPIFLDEKSVDVPLNGPTIAELVESGHLANIEIKDAHTGILQVTGSNIFNVPGYEALAGVLTEAYNQSARGKGKERHADAKPFTEQPIMRISRGRSGIGGLAYQVQKKTDEAIGMVERGNSPAACKEIMGAIVYAAAMILLIREQHAGELPVSHDHHPV